MQKYNFRELRCPGRVVVIKGNEEKYRQCNLLIGKQAIIEGMMIFKCPRCKQKTTFSFKPISGIKRSTDKIDIKSSTPEKEDLQLVE